MMQSFSNGLGMRSEAILRDLQDKISHGNLLPGAELASERQLCREYKISRGTLRRALSRLATDGWITVRHGSGMCISRSPPSRRTKSKNISVMFSIVPEILVAVQKRAMESGFFVCPFPRKELGWDLAAERSFLEQVRHDRQHGLLAFCTSVEPYNDDLLKAMAEEGVRIIHIEHYRDEPPDQNFMLPDYRHAGRLAVGHLRRAGYRTILFSHTQPDWPGARLMRQGFDKTTRSSAKVKAPAYGTYIYPVNDCLPENALAVRTFIRGLSPSTGIICSNALIAKGIIGFAREAGLRCPEDLGVVAAPWMDYYIPFEGLDTVEFDWTGYLVKALDAVMRPEWPVIREYVEPRIVRRGSTRMPGREV